MSSDAYDCCYCAIKMRELRHDFMARVGDEIEVIKDVPALICDTCGGVEYTMEVSREIDVIMKDFFAGRLFARPLAAEEITFKPQRAYSNSMTAICGEGGRGPQWQEQADGPGRSVICIG